MDIRRISYLDRKKDAHRRDFTAKLYAYIDRWLDASAEVLKLWHLAGIFDKEGNPVGSDNPNAYYFGVSAAAHHIGKTYPHLRKESDIQPLFSLRAHAYPHPYDVDATLREIALRGKLNKKDMANRGLIPKRPNK